METSVYSTTLQADDFLRTARMIDPGADLDFISVNPESLERLSRDMADLAVAGVPMLVARPTSTAQVSLIMRAAYDLRVPVVPQGARTGLAGGANAVDGCVLLSLEKMNRIIDIDVSERLATVEPGVLNGDLDREARRHGLRYLPDPGSKAISTIGGNIATNAGGMCCVKYGVTADFVRGLEVVLSDGTILDVGRKTVKGVAGLNVSSLVVGSEGTLAIVTRAFLDLMPLGNDPLTAAAVFSDAEHAVAAAAAIMNDGHRPSVMEFMDEVSVRAVNNHLHAGFPEDSAMLIVQSDAGNAGDEIAVFARIAEEHGAVDVAVAEDVEESNALMAYRRAHHSAVEKLGQLLIDDVCVPRARLVELIRGCQEIGSDLDLTVTLCGHVGDGNMHPIIVFDGADDAQRGRAEEAFTRIMRLGVSLGGTITGEHGVGSLKREALFTTELSEASAALQERIKAAFDPTRILNPGKQVR